MKKISTKTIQKSSGIYFIKNIISKKVYIGQSINLYKRLILHKHELITNKHSNSHLQRSFNKHGIGNFKCGVIEYCDNLTNRELFYINNQKNEIYNIKEASDSIKHQKRKPITEKTRKKLSDAKKGKKPPNLEWLQQQNRKQIGYYNNEELLFVFLSCKDAARYFKMTPKLFNRYIGIKRKSKYFKDNHWVNYYNERKEMEGL